MTLPDLLVRIQWHNSCLYSRSHVNLCKLAFPIYNANELENILYYMAYRMNSFIIYLIS